MREELRTIGSKGRHVFTATFVRFGFRNGYIGPVKTMLLQDVTLDSKIVSDHLWFDLTKGFSDADLSPGDVVEFCARVSAYEKGYKGHKDDVLNRPIERDYRLSRPTKIKKIELTVDEFIRGRMKKVVDSNIETMVESKAKSFVNELRKRYDMAFAAFVVDSMRKQNMLKDEKIAELLKDNPDER